MRRFAVRLAQDSGSPVSPACSWTLPWSAIAFAGADPWAAMTAFTLVAAQPGDPVPKSVNVEPSSGAVTIVVRDAPATMTAITAINSPERARPRHAAGPRPRDCRHTATASAAAMIAASSGPPSPRNAPPTAAATRSASAPRVSSRQNRVANDTRLELACHIEFPVDSMVEYTARRWIFSITSFHRSPSSRSWKESATSAHRLIARFVSAPARVPVPSAPPQPSLDTPIPDGAATGIGRSCPGTRACAAAGAATHVSSISVITATSPAGATPARDRR